MDTKHIIWTTDITDEDLAAAKEEMAENGKKDPTDSEIWEWAQENNSMWFDDEQANLGHIYLTGEIFLMGTLQRWDGKHSVYNGLGTKNVGKSLQAALDCFDGDNSFEIYVEDGRMYLAQWGHDNPTSPSIMEFRAILGYDSLEDYKNDDRYSICPDLFKNSDAPSELLQHSMTPAREVSDVYGWEYEKITAEKAVSLLAGDVLGTDEEMFEAKKMALAALRKEVPMKVRIQEWIDTKCPTGCGHVLSTDHGDGYYSIEEKPARCPRCGQMLDWSRKEEENED